MKKKQLLLTFLLCLSLLGQSQENQKKNAFAVSFGAPGLGLEYARKLTPKLNAKVVWHSLKVKDFEQKDIEIKDDTVDLLANLDVSIIDLGIEYLPFKNSSFKLTTGIGILSNMDLNAVVTYTEEVQFGDVKLSKKDVGEIIADVSWSGIAPYLGIGFGRAIPKKRFGIGFELGSYFTSSPDVILTASKLLSPTSNQQENLKESLSTFKFIPKIEIRISYKF